MNNATYTILSFLTSKWFWLSLFIVLVCIGTIMLFLDKRKGKGDKDELDKTVASFSGMNESPWREEAPQTEGVDEEGQKVSPDAEKGKLEQFYSEKTSRRANLKRIIWTEKNIMRDRAADVAKEENKKK